MTPRPHTKRPARDHIWPIGWPGRRSGNEAEAWLAGGHGHVLPRAADQRRSITPKRSTPPSSRPLTATTPPSFSPWLLVPPDLSPQTLQPRPVAARLVAARLVALEQPRLRGDINRRNCAAGGCVIRPSRRG